MSRRDGFHGEGQLSEGRAMECVIAYRQFEVQQGNLEGVDGAEGGGDGVLIGLEGVGTGEVDVDESTACEFECGAEQDFLEGHRDHAPGSA